MQAAAATQTTTTTEPASVVQLRPTRRTLDVEHVKDLQWYAKQNGGLFAPQASTFAAMIERLALMSFGSRNCTRCGGSKSKPGRGFVARGRVPYAEQLRRWRLAQMKREGLSAAGSPQQVERLRALGLDAYTWKTIAEFFPELPALGLRDCPECHGRGVIPRTTRSSASKPLTARPNGGSRKGGSGSSSGGMNEQDLRRRGRIDRRLARVRTAQPSTAGVLDTYYAQQNGRETLIAIWHLTAAGRKMLRENHLGLTTRAFFQNRIDQQRLNPDKHRAWLHAEADRQAAELLELAVVTWNEVRQ